MSGWTYTEGDAGLSLFSAVYRTGQLPMPTSGSVLEIGCCEADWLKYAHEAWPDLHLVGIDTALRPGKAQRPDEDRIWRMRYDAMDATHFRPEHLDAVVSLSAIEHVGLGHYGDPIDPDGDTKALANAFRWLKPGGVLYFDVPYDPTKYYQLNTECRVYDDVAIQERLWIRPLAQSACKAQWLGTWYADSRYPGTLIEKPTTPAQRYYYAAIVARKVG